MVENGMGFNCGIGQASRRFSSNQRYRLGSITSVSSVEVISPPMTTTANWRCTYEPGPMANRNGTSPSSATEAVIIPGGNAARSLAG
jgi:hypothetical protein